MAFDVLVKLMRQRGSVGHPENDVFSGVWQSPVGLAGAVHAGGKDHHGVPQLR